MGLKDRTETGGLSGLGIQVTLASRISPCSCATEPAPKCLCRLGPRQLLIVTEQSFRVALGAIPRKTALRSGRWSSSTFRSRVSK